MKQINNLEYACASGMSFFASDTKGDLARNYATIAKKYYGYDVSVLGLRNLARFDGNNLVTLINRYMDMALSRLIMMLWHIRPRSCVPFVDRG